MEGTGLLGHAPFQSREKGLRGAISKFPWLLELGALLLSSSALFTAIAILASYQGKLVTEWSFPTSINTVIAVLGAINKATLAFAVSACIGQHKWNLFKAKSGKLGLFECFDEASRGPWGSLWLILHTKGKSWGSLGAVVLILSLAVDPFMQASVAFSGKITPVDNTDIVPTLPGGQTIDIGRLIPTEGLGEGILGMGPPDPDFFRQGFDFGLSGAIYSGLGNSVRDTPSSPQVSFRCSTGNCTWPAFTTAAVCSTCNDVTPILSKTQADNCRSDNGSDQVLNRFSGIEEPCTTFTAPYGRIRQFNGYIMNPITSLSELPLAVDYRVLLTANITMDYTQTISFPDLETMFLAYIVLRVSDDFAWNETTWEDSEPTATECGLYFCAKAYNSRVESGNLTEHEEREWAIRDPQSWSPLNHNNESWMAAHSSLDPTRYYRTDLVLTIPPDEAKDIGDAATTFNITQATITGLQGALRSLTIETSIDTDENGTIVQTERPLVFPQSVAASYEYPLGEILWNSTNLTAEFERLANRLTVEFRESLPSTLSGSALLYQLHIKVEWEYLVLPAFSLAVGWGYLALLIIQTRRIRLPVWKESIYPSLAHGFDENTQAWLRTLDDSPRSAEKTRDNTTIRLVDAKDGMRLEVTGDDASQSEKRLRGATYKSLDADGRRQAVGENHQYQGIAREGQLRRIGSAPAICRSRV